MIVKSSKLREKKGWYYVDIGYINEKGESDRKWLRTGLSTKENKKTANSRMKEIVAAFEAQNTSGKIKVVFVEDKSSSILFADYILDWHKNPLHKWSMATRDSYERLVVLIANYFRTKGTTLKGLTTEDIVEYYKHMRENGKTIQECTHHHSVIRKALKQAVGKYIEFNPASEDRMGDSRPISPAYSAKHYNIKQLKLLFEALKGDPFEFMYMIKAYYGLRRSELMGIKWESIDIENNTISINHSVVKSNHEGKRVLDKKDKLKTKSSRRSYPLLPPFKTALLAEKERQEKNKALYKSSYKTDDAEYVWVDDIGKLINPEKVSRHFKTVLKQNKLPTIRLHDLRHSSASLLLAMGFNVKEIQAWLGHSAAKTTLDTYSHINVDSSKQNIADALSKAFNSEEDENPMPNAEVEEFKQAKAKARELGLSMKEYYEYLEFKTRKEN